MESSHDHGLRTVGHTAVTSLATAAGAHRAGNAAAIGASIQSLAALLNRNLRQALRGEDLSAAHWKVPKQIERTDPVSIGAVAAALETSPGTVGHLARHLVDLGYVGDDACGRLEISPVGLAVIRRIEHAVELQQSWLSLDIDSQDLSIFQQVCERLGRVLQDAEALPDRMAA